MEMTTPMPSMCRVLCLVFLHAAIFGECSGSRGGHRYQPVQPTVTRDTGACSYVINIPTPETSCQHFEYRNEMERMKERVRILESRLADLFDSKHSAPGSGPYTTGYSSEEEFSSSVSEIGRTPVDGSAPSGKPPIQGVLIPQHPMPPLREVTPVQPHVPYIPDATSPRGKPPQEDLIPPQATVVPLDQTGSGFDGKQPKKPATISSTKPGIVDVDEEGGEEEDVILVAGTQVNESMAGGVNDNQDSSVAAINTIPPLPGNSDNEGDIGNPQGSVGQSDVLRVGEKGNNPGPTDQVANQNNDGTPMSRTGHQFSADIIPDPSRPGGQGATANVTLAGQRWHQYNGATLVESPNTDVLDNQDTNGNAGPFVQPDEQGGDKVQTDATPVNQRSENQPVTSNPGQNGQTTAHIDGITNKTRTLLDPTKQSNHGTWIISVEHQGQKEDTDYGSQTDHHNIDLSSRQTGPTEKQDNGASVVGMPSSDQKDSEDTVPGPTRGVPLPEDILNTTPLLGTSLPHLSENEWDVVIDHLSSTSEGSAPSEDIMSYSERSNNNQEDTTGSTVDPEDEVDSTAPVHPPALENLSPTTSEKSISTTLQGGYSSFIFSSSEGDAREGVQGVSVDDEQGEGEVVSTAASVEGDTTQEEGGIQPTTRNDKDKAKTTTELANKDKPGVETKDETTDKPFMGKMRTQDGHRGDLKKPRWKTFKDRMDLKTLRGYLVMEGEEKRPRSKGMGKPNDCILDGCLCLRKKGHVQTGVYYLANPVGSGRRGRHVRLFCDMKTDGGGWTVIQQRQNGTTNFYRGWDDYAKGFGRLDGDFWIGNSMLHAITARSNFMLRVEFTDWDGNLGYAEYDRFRVGDESDNFRLNLGYYLGGNSGDSLSYHNGSQFSTRDRDNDESGGSCSFLRQAGFWFKACNKANPNGRWLGQADARGLNGATVTWGTWEGRKYTYCLRSFRMMIRSQNLLSALTAGPKHRPGGQPQPRRRT